MAEETPPDPAPSGLAASYAAHRGELVRFLRARCGDADLAEDLVQDLWLRLGPSGPVANPRAYLFRMANNLVLDFRRGERRAMARDRAWIAERGEDDAPEAIADPAPDAEAALLEAEDARELAGAIAALPAGAARALRLHRIEQRPQAEVAQIMGISRSGVEKHLATAFRHLRKILVRTPENDCGSPAPVASGRQEDPEPGAHRGAKAP